MKFILMGAGYVGTALLNSFQYKSHEFFITTTREEKVEELKAYGNVLLLNCKNNLKEWVDMCDGMIILIAPKNSQNYDETYRQTAKTVSLSLKNRKRPFYLVYTSSTSVCEGKEGWVTEEMPLSPTSENAKILLETEYLYLNSGVDACILRLGGIYGPKRELIDRAKRFSGKEMSGTGNESTNHIHLADIVSAISFCIDHRLTGVYHLVNEDHTTRKELYSTLCKSADIPSPIWSPGLEQTGYKVSNRKIKDAGFIFKHPFTSS